MRRMSERLWGTLCCSCSLPWQYALRRKAYASLPLLEGPDPCYPLYPLPSHIDTPLSRPLIRPIPDSTPLIPCASPMSALRHLPRWKHPLLHQGTAHLRCLGLRSSVLSCCTDPPQCSAPSFPRHPHLLRPLFPRRFPSRFQASTFFPKPPS